MNLKNQTVLVTGGGGFIGSRLCERLVQSDANVRAFVRYTSRAEIGLLRFLEPDILKKIEIIRGDLRDFSAVAKSLRGLTLSFTLARLSPFPIPMCIPLRPFRPTCSGR